MNRLFRTNVFILLCVIILLSTACNNTSKQSPDGLVPPAAEKAAGSNTQGNIQNNNRTGNQLNNQTNSQSGNQSNSQLNNQWLANNVAPMTLPASNMEYMIPKDNGMPASICADNKYLYVLRKSDPASGAPSPEDSIELYDAESGALIRRISDKILDGCCCITVADSNIYAFNKATGKLLLFSSTGRYLSSFNTSMAGKDVTKIVVLNNGQVAMKLISMSSLTTRLAVLDTLTEKVTFFEPQQLLMSPNSGIPEINDICMYKDNQLLITFSSTMLSLFDIKTGTVLKTSIFPASDGFIELDGNVLYFVLDGAITMSVQNFANFVNSVPPRFVGRLLINSSYTWPLSDVAEMEKSRQGDLDIPFATTKFLHYGMSQNNRYLFFLDINGDNEFCLYRIAK